MSKGRHIHKGEKWPTEALPAELRLPCPFSPDHNVLTCERCEARYQAMR